MEGVVARRCSTRFLDPWPGHGMWGGWGVVVVVLAVVVAVWAVEVAVWAVVVGLGLLGRLSVLPIC